MMKRGLMAAILGLLGFFAQGAWAANLHIDETPTGVVMSGDGNFTANDWLGLNSFTQTGTEIASLSAQLFNPNGFAGSEIVRILDPNNFLSDVLTIAFSGSVVGTFTATFCSNDNGNVCSDAGFTRTVFEDALGNFDLGAAIFDPNLAIQGSSTVPEPTTLALLGLGLAGLAASRRRKQ